MNAIIKKSIEDVIESKNILTLDLKDIIKLFKIFSEISKTEGILALEEVQEICKDIPELQIAIRYIEDYDASDVELMLLFWKKTIIKSIETKLDMIREGVLAIQNDKNPSHVEIILKMFDRL